MKDVRAFYQIWLANIMVACHLKQPTSGGALPLIFCIHVHSGPIYWEWVLFTLQKVLKGDGFLHVSMFHYFKSPILHVHFLKFTYNEYVGPYF